MKRPLLLLIFLFWITPCTATEHPTPDTVVALIEKEPADIGAIKEQVYKLHPEQINNVFETTMTMIERAERQRDESFGGAELSADPDACYAGAKIANKRIAQLKQIVALLKPKTNIDELSFERWAKRRLGLS